MLLKPFRFNMLDYFKFGNLPDFPLVVRSGFIYVGVFFLGQSATTIELGILVLPMVI